MGNIIIALLVGGFATLVLLWGHGPWVAIIAAPFGASLLAVIAAVCGWLLGHPLLSSKRSKKEMQELDRQGN
jgi:integral membrane sensor domain MASE1